MKLFCSSNGISKCICSMIIIIMCCCQQIRIFRFSNDIWKCICTIIIIIFMSTNGIWKCKYIIVRFTFRTIGFRVWSFFFLNGRFFDSKFKEYFLKWKPTNFGSKFNFYKTNSKFKLRSISTCYWGWFKSWFVNGFEVFDRGEGSRNRRFQIWDPS